MTKASTQFEQRIHRIHELLENTGAEVVWNDKVPDPDNPSQARQIDIAIRRGGKLTIVECRVHQAVQDVKWIEELIGRRISLAADAVIAVSNSGFTAGAFKKAAAHGIILRDLRTLTIEEICAWGASTKIILTFLEFQAVRLTVLLATTEATPPLERVLAQLRESPVLFHVFTKTSDWLDQNGVSENSTNFSMNCLVSDVSFDGVTVDGFEVKGAARRITKTLEIASVVAYDAPDVKTSERGVLIEKVPLGDFEITHSRNNVCIAADLGAIVCPPNCIFMYFGTSFSRQVSIRSFEVLRPPPFGIRLDAIEVATVVRQI